MKDRLVLMKVFYSALANSARRFRRGRAAVALIVALSTPILIGVTGLAVDIGFWYQQQVAVQSAADAGALAAARAAHVDSSLTNTQAQAIAVAAANEATNNQFNLTSSAVVVSTNAVTVNGQASTQWVAKVTIPRASFFSGVGFGSGAGLAPGNQGTSGSADIVSTAGGNLCMNGTSITVTGGAKVTCAGTNAEVYASESGCVTNTGNSYAGSIVVTGSGQVIGPVVATAASCVHADYSAYIGTPPATSSGPPSNTSTVTLNAPAVADPMNTTGTTTYLGSPPSSNWPTMPTMPTIPSMPTAPSSLSMVPSSMASPSATSSSSYISANLGWGTSGTWGSCPSDNCSVLAGSYSSGLTPGYTASTILNSNNGATYAQNGLSFAYGGPITLDGNAYYVSSGGMSVQGSPLTIQTTATPETFVVYGASTLASSAAFTLPSGSYYFNSASSTSSSATSTGLTIGNGGNTAGVTFAGPPSGSAFIVYGGLNLIGGTSASFGPGTYYLTGTTSNATNSSAVTPTGYGLTFAGNSLTLGNTTTNSTVYINGGVSDSNGSTLSFGQGTFYLSGYGGGYSQYYSVDTGLNVSGSGTSVTTANNSTYYITGGVNLAYGNDTFGSGTYYIGGPTSGTTSASGSVVSYGLVSTSPSLTMTDSSTYYVNGGMELSGAITAGVGTYYSYAPTNAQGVATSWGMNFGQSNSSTTFGLSAADSSNTTPSYYYILGGLYVVNGSYTFPLGTYYFTGGNSSCSGTSATVTAICFQNGSTFKIAGGTAYMNGSTFLQNAAVTFGTGTYEFYAPTNASGVATNWAITTNTNSFTLNATAAYIKGGLYLSGSNPTVTFGSGLYEFTAYSGNGNSSCTNSSCTTGAFADDLGTTTFGSTYSGTGTPAAATYFFDGGLTIGGGSSTITLNPGIYYIRNGNLSIGSGSHVTGTDVTIVLEGSGSTGAAIYMGGGSTLNITAPSSNCVATASYPESTSPNDYVDNTPFDGTNGQGICGVAIYQQRGDTATNTINQGAGSVINGAFYAPSSALVVGGAGAMTVNSTGIPCITAAAISVTGAGNITMNQTPSSSGGTGGSGGQPVFALVQ